MVKSVNLSTPEGKKEYFVKQGVINGAAPAAVGLGIAAAGEFLMNKSAMKDEFKTAKQAIKDAKAQNLSKDAIKEAKKGLKDLYAKAAQNTFKDGKRAILPIAAAIAGVALFKGLVFPAVEQYLHGNNDKKAAK